MILEPACEVDGDLMDVARDGFEDAILTTEMANGAPALQLGRLAQMRLVIRTAIEKRLKNRPHAINADWRALLDQYLLSSACVMPALADEDYAIEQQAREEKTAALDTLARARLSVLNGPAGTGKTTLLLALCSHPKIAEGGLLLLAPTGKAQGALGAGDPGSRPQGLHYRSVPEPTSL